MNRNTSILFCLVTVACLASGVWAIYVFRKTVVPFSHVLLVIFVGGITGAFIYHRIVKKRIRSASALWSLVISGASLVPFCFLYTNLIFAGKGTQSEICPIEKKGTLPARRRCAQPYLDVRFANAIKRLTYFCKDRSLVDSAKAVEVVYQNGLFGYPVIFKQRVVK